MSSFKLVTLSVDYYQKFKNFHELEFSNSSPGGLNFSQKSIDDFINNSYYNVVITIDELNDVCAYMIYTCCDFVDIISVYVGCRFREIGLASKMLDFLFMLNFGNDIFLEVAEDNVAAISLYMRKGFEKISTRKKYTVGLSGELVDSFVMRKCFT